MEMHSDPRVLSADRTDNGVVVVFDDGKCAFYSALLLHATLPQAKEIPEDGEDDI